VVAVDLVGPMPQSAKANNWILVLMDHFTRWANALATPDTPVPTVAKPWIRVCFVTLVYSSRFTAWSVPAITLLVKSQAWTL